MENKIKVDIGNGFSIVAELSTDPAYPREMYVYVSDKDGTAYQDLVIVRNAYHYDDGHSGPVYEDNQIDMLIFGDENVEDITDTVTVGIHKEEE